MSLQELQRLLDKVRIYHSPIAIKPALFRSIKYVDFNYDNRTGGVFNVTLRGFGQADANFHVCNEQRDLPDSLYDRIIYWLENK